MVTLEDVVAVVGDSSALGPGGCRPCRRARSAARSSSARSTACSPRARRRSGCIRAAAAFLLRLLRLQAAVEGGAFDRAGVAAARPPIFFRQQAVSPMPCVAGRRRRWLHGLALCRRRRSAARPQVRRRRCSAGRCWRSSATLALPARRGRACRLTAARNAARMRSPRMRGDRAPLSGPSAVGHGADAGRDQHDRVRHHPAAAGRLSEHDAGRAAVAGRGRVSTARSTICATLYGLDRPLWEQYLYWAWGLLHGDLGYSFEYDRPVSAGDRRSGLPHLRDLVRHHHLHLDRLVPDRDLFGHPQVQLWPTTR